ncbi:MULTISPECIES: carbohydrate ABC transporter permease [Aurantimicrobium]|jgi:raffinose/stachyose/melibiose transport system permease protein|uniref:Lactose transport system permease protein LacF n=2 Tax=Aurantimicrobium TaxID=1705353 RepID=A0A2Z3S4J7_9MICO|nr:MULTISPECIES: sugar ABC transporter permease [Aurantimicrobium]AWR21222.1 Lactose transport system permease protein LacF [Aurantimicrobium photophilum]MDF9809243.1 raffinose/stachyose/melibiose transport system permease protein [Aurantimicrobium minutum]MDH6208166.1 raffinose/stachyose/melibiose transport system permease protein [Aurantimicrobium minutum]MDH6255239.1 raffinose/stachyose/melibiose transport system permease protein [Aurantimicrobium minutum]MDH6409371.1 raffinose/stachyose/me
MTALTSGKTRKKSTITNGVYWPYMVPGLIAFTLIVIVSFVWNIYLSFTKWNGLGAPKWIGFDNYAKLMVDETFWQSFLHSVVFIFAMAIVPTALGLIIASALFDYISPRFGNATSAASRAGFFLPQIIPIPIAGLLWTWMLSSQTGIVNKVLTDWGHPEWAQNWLGDAKWAMFSVTIVLIWIQVGYTIVIFMSGLARADQSVHEAAAIDGATWFQRFRIITLNQLAPEIAVVLLTTTVAALKVFAPVYVMTQGGPGTATTVPAYYSYFNFIQTSKVGYGAAISTVLAILLIIMSLVIFRYQNKQGENR